MIAYTIFSWACVYKYKKAGEVLCVWGMEFKEKKLKEIKTERRIDRDRDVQREAVTATGAERKRSCREF